MISGVGTDQSRGDRRKALLTERDERIIEFMEQRRSVAVIAELEGIETDYCRKATRRLAETHGIKYNPDKEPVPAGLLTDASRVFRRNMANILYDYRNAPGRHPLEVCRDTGLTQFQQTIAAERGGQHDLKLSQLERIASATDKPFRTMMLRALLSKDEYQKVIKCLST